MSILGTLLILAGGITMLVGGIMILIAAFKESVMWGVLALLVPFAAFVFVFTHFAEAKKGFFIWLAGLPLYAIGFGIVIASAVGQVHTDMERERAESGAHADE
jgi:hypothetical protein